MTNRLSRQRGDVHVCPPSNRLDNIESVGKGVPTRLNRVVALPTVAETLTSTYSPFWTVTEGSK